MCTCEVHVHLHSACILVQCVCTCTVHVYLCSACVQVSTPGDQLWPLPHPWPELPVRLVQWSRGAGGGGVLSEGGLCPPRPLDGPKRHLCRSGHQWGKESVWGGRNVLAEWRVRGDIWMKILNWRTCTLGLARIGFISFRLVLLVLEVVFEG